MRNKLEHIKRQSKIHKLIYKSPGIRYRQLQRTTGLPNGSLSYILRELEYSRRIIVERTSYVTAYYPKETKTAELHLMENLRNNIDRRIVQYLLEQGKSTFYDIVNHSKRAPSTVSWHLNRLRNRKLIISTSHGGKPQAYKIINKYAVSRILSKHARKFVSIL
jgi:predicted transcriptional regulator